jgi:lactoylglutathione lyase
MTLSHLNLDVTDLDRSERFYRDVLGLLVTRRSDSLFIRCGDAILVLAAGPPIEGGTFHFGFRVADDAAVDAWFARLRTLDVPVVEMPARRGSVFVGRLRDPDGYAIEIYADHPET